MEPEDPSDAEELRSFLQRGPGGRSDVPMPEPTSWMLESVGAGYEIRRMPIPILPFRIGRRPGLELVLPSDLVSKTHAEVYERNGDLRVRDLQSRNGTFLNRRPVSDEVLSDGDVIHIGDFEFRIVRRTDADDKADTSSTAAFDPSMLSHFFPEGAKELRGLIDSGAVGVVFQPLVRFPSRDVVAWEALGRGNHPKLPDDPLALFRIAESLGLEVGLARLFRRRAVELARRRPSLGVLFLNTHPNELGRPGLVESLEELRMLAPRVDLILEIHESALAQPAAMALLREQLAEINVGLAYDDFGAGQARLDELARVAPDCVKFDMRLVRDLHRATSERRLVAARLVELVRDLGIVPLAEGIECEAEAAACREIGFELAQGFFFGRPQPIAAHIR